LEYYIKNTCCKKVKEIFLKTAIVFEIMSGS